MWPGGLLEASSNPQNAARFIPRSFSGMDAHYANLAVALALVAGVFVQCVSRTIRFPAIVGLLALGVGLGPDGLGWVRPGALGQGLYGLVDFGVAIILFEGGLNLQWRQIRQQERTIRRLITVGAVVTLAGGAAAAHFLAEIPWKTALLFGSLVVVTGPTVVTPLLRDMRLQPRLKTILEAEGVLIDPVGVVLAVLTLQFVSAPTATTALQGVVTGLSSFGFGLVAGLAAGFLLSQMLRWRWLIPAGFEGIFTLGAAVALLPACDLVVGQSGILAVVVAGMVVGNRPLPGERELREFKDQLTLLMVAMLFVLLAANVRLDDVRALGRPGLLVVGVLIFAVRPLGVMLSTLGSDLPLRDRFFISWVAPRGIVAAAVASLTALNMREREMEGGDQLRALVFLTIASTVLLAGLTARPMASLLRLRLPRRNRVAILGADWLPRKLAGVFREHNVPVVLLDTDPTRCREAEQEGFAVVFGDALQERTLMRAQFELVEFAIGLTGNEHLNRRFARAAHELFRVPRTLVAQGVGRTDDPQNRVVPHAPEPLFERAHDVERWDVRVRQQAVETVRLVYQPPKTPPPAPEQSDTQRLVGGTDNHLFLAVRRSDKLQPMFHAWKPRGGDVAIALLYRPHLPAALDWLAAQGWTRVMEAEAPGTAAKTEVKAQ